VGLCGGLLLPGHSPQPAAVSEGEGESTELLTMQAGRVRGGPYLHPLQLHTAMSSDFVGSCLSSCVAECYGQNVLDSDSSPPCPIMPLPTATT
jgi:hypothetical protein